MKIEKKDIPILKGLLSELIKPINSNGIDFDSLPKDFKQNFNNNNNDLDTEFRRFANIFDKAEAGKFEQSQTGWALILRTSNSYGFDFDDYFKTQNRKERKAELDFQISKIKAKTFIPVLILGSFGGIYSGISLLKDFGIIPNKEIETQQQADEIQNQESTLIKDNETIDNLQNKILKNSDTIK
ncbi:hypothetical protein [Reichenbachiella sp. MSK19-1]|uniref:hypothetical protein n=1 Tax=Reichenbachiella sp. MSK19-1 TaxID=1897631 RepID=UPI000E6BF8B0|nr:hypothetical protein [Reichenbachiella sp. MSK19-1]RJE72965.1 hypothetical protein BGP76_03190 [Reichenbachiella sp. MSK19-1]